MRIKPSSVIFLAFAALLVIAGAITCSVAQSEARAEGVSIFDSEYDDDGNAIERVDLTTESINKISISLSDCSVTVKGGAEKSEALLVNFGKYGVGVSTSESVLDISDELSYRSFIRFSSGGFSFDGLRYIFPFGGKGKTKIPSGAKKSVIITLSDKDSVKNYNITVESGDITFEGIPTKADVKLKTGNGNVNITQSADEGITYSVRTDNGNVLFAVPDFASDAEIRALDGDIKLTIRDTSEAELHLDAPLGLVSYYGTSSSHSYNSATTFDNKLSACADKGSIVLEAPAETTGE